MNLFLGGWSSFPLGFLCVYRGVGASVRLPFFGTKIAKRDRAGWYPLTLSGLQRRGDAFTNVYCLSLYRLSPV